VAISSRSSVSSLLTRRESSTAPDGLITTQWCALFPESIPAHMVGMIILPESEIWSQPLSITTPARPYPNDRCRKSQSAVELSVGRRAAIPSEPSMQRADLSHTHHPRGIGNLRHPGLAPLQQRKEGDLITGAENKSAIGTLVERSTGYVMLLHLPNSHGAEDVQQAMVETMSRLPPTLRRTLTWNQGQEMANHAAIASATQLEIYFCDPHSPWQRATKENTNGLLRQYFPKSTDLSGYHRDYLKFVATQLNNRPRKRLGWRTPAEALDQLLSAHGKPPGVALTC
jgi:IS30 family transposase